MHLHPQIQNPNAFPAYSGISNSELKLLFIHTLPKVEKYLDCMLFSKLYEFIFFTNSEFILFLILFEEGSQQKTKIGNPPFSRSQVKFMQR